MYTFLQIQEEVFSRLREEVGDTGFWTTDDVKRAINSTYFFIADRAMCFRLEEIIEIIAGIRVYKLPENYVHGSLDRVEFDNERIDPITAAELDSYSRAWRDRTASKITHYLPPGDICNTDEIAVYPSPDTSGSSYNLASESKDRGVVTTIGDDSYEEFETEEGVIIDTDGEAYFDEAQGTGPVLDIQDPTNNLKIFGAKYPKKLYRDEEVFLHPIRYNPQEIITKGSLAILLTKEGEGKDIQKSSYFNKRFEESLYSLNRKVKTRRIHRMKSITETSIGGFFERGTVNLGGHYPVYHVR